MSEPSGIQPLRAYLEGLDSTDFVEYSTRATSRVSDEDAFGEMRSHISRLYEGVEAMHSFLDVDGGIIDCIPIEQQPALRGSREAIPTAPDLPPLEAEPDDRTGTPTLGGESEGRTDSPTKSQLSPDRRDWYGNAMNCPEGTIPMRRITLEDMARFETLQDFLRKGPGGAGRPPRIAEPATVPVTHRWAHAYQNVTNGGGHSFLNIWQPAIGANQVFSLSQHWYVGGGGANLQTIECGWNVYPALYGGNAQPHLFTYWTADNYNTTGGYNLTGGAFVQTSSSFAPGMVVGPVSVSGGSQYSMELSYWLAGGRWWLYYNGTQGSNAIGYYPVTLYGSGALATQASEIDYGGETTGTTSFPAMGSGAFANAGWQRAAYQRTIGYWPPQGGAMINASLTPSQGWPACYTAEVVLYAAPWSETLWFGGPGGAC
jgi:hypothetical protein